MVELLRQFGSEPDLVIKYRSIWLASHLGNGAQLLLDGDGVLAKSDSLTRTKWLAPGLIKSIKQLELLGVRVGLATARSQHFVERLRVEGLLIDGVSILEDGQAVFKNGKMEYLAPLEHRRFLGELRNRLKLVPGFKNSWNEVLAGSESSFCRGNHQWQGRARASWWFRQTGDYAEDGLKMKQIFEPTLLQATTEFGLVVGRDVGLSLIRMKTNGLAIFAVRCNGFEKASAIGKLESPAVFVADGEGDLNLGTGILAGGGGIIGIKGNLDISSEPAKFLEEKANWVVASPQQLIPIFGGTSRLLV